MSDDDGAVRKSLRKIKLRMKRIFHRPVVSLVGWIGSALFLIISGVFGAFGEDIYLFVEDLCSGGPSPPNWHVSMSMSVPHCYTGYLPVIFREYEPKINWADEADNLSICANADVEGPRQNVPQLLGDRFDECISVTKESGVFAIATNINSAAICRAPYRYEEGDIKPASLPGGLFVCMPGHDREEGKAGYRLGGVEVPECKEENLKEYGFL